MRARPEQIERDRIHEIACRVLGAIEALLPNVPFPMAHFPRGACGDTCLLLGAFLSDVGETDILYISGARGTHDEGNWTTHAWLARGGLVIDITADQFADAPEGVIVTRNSAWHQLFVADSPQPSDYRVWHGPGTHHLAAFYPVLLRKLREVES